MKFLVINSYIKDRHGFPRIVYKEEIANLYGIEIEETMDTFPEDYYWIRLDYKYDNNHNIPRAAHETIRDYWVPEITLRTIKKVESMSFLERLKFLFTSKVKYDIIK